MCLLLTVFGWLLGTVATWFFARLYYKRAGDELRQAAALLHKASNAIIYFLENPSADIQVQRDNTGRPTEVRVSAVDKASGSSTRVLKSGGGWITAISILVQRHEIVSFAGA